MTSKHGIYFTLIAVAVAAALGFADTAAGAAKKKISFAEAWKQCKAQLDKEKVPPTTTSNERYLRGGACMKNFGYDF